MDGSFAEDKEQSSFDRPVSVFSKMMETPAAGSKGLYTSFKKSNTPVLNIQRSIQLLDEAVGSSNQEYFSKIMETPNPKHLRHSQYSPKHLPPFMITPHRTSTDHQRGTLTAMGNLSQNQSSCENISSIVKFGQVGTTFLEMQTEDVTTTNVALLLEDQDFATSVNVYSDFMDAYKAMSTEHQVFDLLQQYKNICSERVVLIKKLLKRTAPNSQKFKKTMGVFDLLKEEMSTWQLISSLFKDRLEAMWKEMESIEEPMLSDTQLRYISDKNIVNSLFRRDGTIREGQIVVDWLESCAYEDLERLTESNKIYSDHTVGWENTLHRLKNRKNPTISTCQRRLVDEMDPDAPLRDGKILDDLDGEDENHLLMYLFACIRAGNLAKAQEISKNSGHAWRAATLEGWRLYHDPNFETSVATNQVSLVEGNPYRDVWKRVCLAMSQEVKHNQYERAMYGILCGNLRAVLPVCQSWGDYVWAYFRVFVDTKVEQEIRLCTTSTRPLEKLMPQYLERCLDPETIFREIEACNVESIKIEAQKWFFIVQKLVILGDMNGLIEVMYQWVCADKKTLPVQLTRFMAHLVLLLRTIGLVTTPELCTSILETYVENLISHDYKILVATYVATLPKEAQITAYAHFLEEIHEKEERQVCLELAKEAGLDIPLITKTVVENIRKRDVIKPSLDPKENIDTAISEEDQQKIEAIDWLVFDPSQRAEALKQANAVMRVFLALNKPSAARQVFEKLPRDSVDVVYKVWYRQTGSFTLSPEDSNAIRENMCIKAYLDAVESFNDWFSLYHQSKPTKPNYVPGSNFTECVAYEHHMKQYHAELERWNHSLELQTTATKERIYNVLLFTDGGWMVDHCEADYPNDARSHQMLLLRQLCLPSICFQLYKILHVTEQYMECLQLADIIAKEGDQLYKVFGKDELQHMVQLLRSSSLILLDENRDPLGYEM